ncbi:hypothetical protein L6255_04350 [Candidatus Parcubacteria bacterium]|nr:hypothetical protein [Patescibacteria group bacterium]MCG2689640.1 hypothetical protein [Candidatus Parcubacteria bacterium]
MKFSSIVTPIVAIALFVGIFLLLQANRPKLPSSDKVILYFGNTCPHCRDVEEYITENKIKEKVDIEEKEVYQDKINSAELALVALSCNIASDQIFVPFMYAEGKCLVGVEEIKQLLNSKAGLVN